MSTPRRMERRRLAAAFAVALVWLACSDREPEPSAPTPAPPSEQAPSPAPPGPPLGHTEPAPEPVSEPPAPPPPSPPAASPPAEVSVAERISLEELGERIKQTPAIGVFTKLALKNDIDDLVEGLRSFHDRGEGRIDRLRESYDGLVLKLLALLEKDEPELALALARSREDIWKVLVDPVRFAKLPT